MKDVGLEFPRFNGQDVLDWIFKAEQFFDYHNTPNEERVPIAAIHMDKLVLPWFQMIQRITPFHSWHALTKLLET